SRWSWPSSSPRCCATKTARGEGRPSGRPSPRSGSTRRGARRQGPVWHRMRSFRCRSGAGACVLPPRLRWSTAVTAHDLFLLGGVFPGVTPGETLRGLVGHARAAEAARLGGVLVAEHHCIEYGANPSATLMSAHLLAATERIQVGTSVAVLSTRHPVALGEEAATLDALAPGRFRLGVGRGGPCIDLEVFGGGLDRFERGFEEALRLLVRWLSGTDETAAHAGEFFTVPPVRVMPPGSGGPVWTAATSEGTARLAGRLG